LPMGWTSAEKKIHQFPAGQGGGFWTDSKKAFFAGKGKKEKKKKTSNQKLEAILETDLLKLHSKMEFALKR